MSSIYKNLTEEDLKIEKEALKSFEKKIEEKGLGGFDKGFKTIILGGFILSLMSVVGSGYLYKIVNKEKRQRQALEAAQIQIRERASAVEENTEKSKAEIAKLRQQLMTFTTQRAEFQQKFEESRKEVAELRAKLKEIEEKRLAINQAADGIQTELDLQPIGPSLPGTTNLSAAKNAPAPAPAKTAAPAPAAKPAGKNDPKTAAAPSTPAPAASNAAVLTVNRKFNFVVVNLGLKDNLKIGDVLQIQRGGKNVGQVTIEKIYDNFSAATITQEPKDAPIKEGDKITKA